MESDEILFLTLKDELTKQEILALGLAIMLDSLHRETLGMNTLTLIIGSAIATSSPF